MSRASLGATALNVPVETWPDPPPGFEDPPPSESDDAEAQGEPPESKPLADLRRRSIDDPTELLRRGYLCRGGGLLICGQTGIGKSSFALQAAMLWAVGEACFGIEPTARHRSLLIQAENDDGDLAEMRDGVIAGLEMPRAQAQAALANITVACEDTRTGADFTRLTVAPLLEKHRPDLLWVDPSLAYLGGESGAQKDVGIFLRNLINPLLHAFQVGGILTHHTNKPPTGRDKPTWSAGDFAYAGTGSAEWANWARAVLVLRSIGSHDVFELRAGKRGARLGWFDEAGERSYTRHLAHGTKGICWREATPDELPQTGRPKEHSAGELLDLLPDAGLTASEWQKLAKTECGISEATFHRERRKLETAKRILKSRATLKWQPVIEQQPPRKQP
ncbi:MAG: AAA family ATPase [Verrucomicrobiota bacterium]